MTLILTKKDHLQIAISLIIIPFLLGAGIDLYVPSLPAIVKYFHTQDSLVQLTISFYMLGYAIGQIFLGVLSDSFGRKKILVTSCIFYTLVSFLSIFSSNIYMLIFYRLIQGIGIAGLGVIARAMAADCFSGKELTKAMAGFAMSWAIGPIIGPFIGGFLQHYFNWQANFYFFCLYGIIVFFHSWLTIPETHVNLQELNFVKIYKTIINVSFHPVFLVGSCIVAFAYSTLVVFNVMGPFLIQDVLNFSAVEYGRIALVLGVGYLLGNFLNRFMLRHFDSMRIVLFGIICSFIVSAIMLVIALTMKMSLISLLMSIFPIFFLCPLIMPNLVAKCISIFPKLGGTTTAISGSLAAAGVFAVSSISTMLKSTNQIALATVYLAIYLSCFLSFYLIKIFENKVYEKYE